MYRRIKLDNLGGYPLAQEDLDWLQTSYRDCFSALAKMAGDMTIIQGLDDLGGGNYSSGWISINDKLLPFEGGAAGTGEFLIDETATQLTFNDGFAKDALFEEVCRFSAGGGYNISNLIRLPKLMNIWKKDDIRMCIKDAAYVAASFDVDGYGINDELGWRLLSKVYADAAGAAFVNVKEGDADFGTVGDHPGVKEAVMTQGQLPKIPGKKMVRVTGNDTATAFDSSPGELDAKTAQDWPGNDDPISKIQPSFVVLTLIKL